MKDVHIKVNKRISIDDTHVPTYSLAMNVVESVGVPAEIFVTKYIPGSKYTGPAEYVFWNVAYFDELSSIPDTPPNRRAVTYIRRSCLSYACATEAELNDFINTVTSDIKRLVQSVRTAGKLIACSDITVTGDTVTEVSCTDESCTAPVAVPESAKINEPVVSLSFTGE